MAQVKISAPAPDFTLIDTRGNEVALSSYKGEKNVVLVFNRGFM
jgi:peroxiredoxin